MNQQNVINAMFEKCNQNITMSQSVIRSEEELRNVCQSIFNIVDDEGSSYSLIATFLGKKELFISSHACNFSNPDDVLAAIVEVRHQCAIRINFDFSYPVEAVNGSMTLEFVAGGILLSSHREELDV